MNDRSKVIFLENFCLRSNRDYSKTFLSTSKLQQSEILCYSNDPKDLAYKQDGTVSCLELAEALCYLV